MITRNEKLYDYPSRKPKDYTLITCMVIIVAIFAASCFGISYSCKWAGYYAAEAKK